MEVVRYALALVLILLLSSAAVSADNTTETESGPSMFSIASVAGGDPADANKVPLTGEEGFSVEMNTDVDLGNHRLEAEIGGERFGVDGSDSSLQIMPRIHELEEGEHTLTVTISGSFGEKTASTTIDLIETPETESDTNWHIDGGSFTAIPPAPNPTHQVSFDMILEGAEASFFMDLHGEKGLPESVEVTGVSMDSPWSGDASIEDGGIRVNVNGSNGPDRGEIVLTINLDASSAYSEGIKPEGHGYTLKDEDGNFGNVNVVLWARSLPVVLEKPNGEVFVTDKTGREWSKAQEGVPFNEREPAAYVSNFEMTESSSSGPDEDGVWNLHFSPERKDILSANVDGYAAETVNLREIDYSNYGPDNPYVLELEEGAILKATLQDTSGEPLPNGKVLMRRTDGPEHVQVQYEAKAGSDGVTDKHLPPGTYEARPLAPTALPGEKRTLQLEEGKVADPTYSLETPEVVSSEIEHTGGTEPRVDDMEVDSIYHEGAILVQLKPENADGISRQEVEEQGVDVKLHDLSSLGVDSSTELRLTLEMKNFEPDALFWAAKDARWDVESSGDTTTFEVELKPTEIQKIDERHTGFGSSENTDWPSGSNDQADRGYEAAVDFWVFDTSKFPSSVDVNMFEGMSVMTNAQKFGWPRVEGGELSIYMAAPGKTADGEEFTGFYQAFIPDRMLDSWNVDDPETDLQVMWKGSEESFEVNEVDGGVFIEIDPVEFSDGEMRMKSLEYTPPLLEKIPYASQVKLVIQRALSSLLN